MAGRVSGCKLVLLSCILHSVLAIHDLPSLGDESMKKGHGPWLQLKGYTTCPGALISINEEAMTLNVEKCGYLSGGPIAPKFKEQYALATARFLWCSKETCSDDYQRYHEGSYHRISGAGNTIEVQLVHKLYRSNSKRRSISNDPDDTAVLVFFFQACLRCENNEHFKSIVQALTRLDDEMDRSRPSHGTGEKFRIYDNNWQKFKQKFVPLGKKVLGPEITPLLSVFQSMVTGVKNQIEMPFIHYKANYAEKNRNYLSHWLVIPRAIPISEQQAYSFAMRSSDVPSFKHTGAETEVSGLTKDGYTVYTGTSAKKSATPELEYSRFE